jgi:hypothetical protein
MVPTMTLEKKRARHFKLFDNIGRFERARANFTSPN